MPSVRRAHHETYIYWAMIIVMTRRVARTPGRTGTAAEPQVTGKPIREAK